MRSSIVAHALLCLIFSSLTQAAEKVNPENWPNAIKLNDGTIWSDFLPEKYANCISKKDESGKPIIHKDIWGFDSVECRLENGAFVFNEDSYGPQFYAGTSEDQSKVIDSDATAACAAIGGELPNINDPYEAGREGANRNGDFKKYPLLTTTIPSYDKSRPEYYLNYVCDNATCGYLFPQTSRRNNLSSVRCIARPTGKS